jgi:hypothetical protein
MHYGSSMAAGPLDTSTLFATFELVIIRSVQESSFFVTRELNSINSLTYDILGDCHGHHATAIDSGSF